MEYYEFKRINFIDIYIIPTLGYLVKLTTSGIDLGNTSINTSENGTTGKMNFSELITLMSHIFIFPRSNYFFIHILLFLKSGIPSLSTSDVSNTNISSNETTIEISTLVTSVDRTTQSIVTTTTQKGTSK